MARFNRRWTDRFLEPLARRRSGFAVIHHRGRRSGRPYSTPVHCFANGDARIVVPSYGPGADWIRNVQAGPAELEDRWGCHRIISLTLIDRVSARTALPVLVRAATRIIGVSHFVQVRLS